MWGPSGRVVSDLSDSTPRLTPAEMPEASGIDAEASSVGRSWLTSDSRTHGVPQQIDAL